MRKISVIHVLIALLFLVTFTGCSMILPSSSESLQLEEHQLVKEPELVPLSFQPVEGTQAEILAKHAAERALEVQAVSTTIDGNPAITSQGEKTDLTAVVLTLQQGQPDQTVRLMSGNDIVFETPAGLPSPQIPIQSLWTYDGHWALEILYSDQTTWAGRIFIDGQLINDQKGYSEAFGLQLLAGKPFFFYSRDGKVGYSYDGKETDLDFDEVPHYHCCAETEINPLPAQNMVAFFGLRGQTWYYVELGNFKK